MPVELIVSATATDAERLAQAEAAVRAYCGWHIAPSRAETITLDGPGSWLLTLPSLHVSSIVSITEDGTLLTADSDYTWSASGYVVRQPCALWSAKPRSLVVALVHGYDSAPLEVGAVVQSMATRAIDNPHSLTSETIGPFSQTFSSNGGQAYPLTLALDERTILDTYRLPSRP